MARVLIIGYGNPLRGDDAVGWKAAQALQDHFSDPNIEIIACHQLTPELAAAISGSAMVLFIDARIGGAPGTILRSAVAPEVSAGAFSHQLLPGALLALARELYGQVPPAFTFSLCGEDFESSEILSRKVAKNFPHLISQVAAMASLLAAEAIPQHGEKSS